MENWKAVRAVRRKLAQIRKRVDDRENDWTKPAEAAVPCKTKRRKGV